MLCEKSCFKIFIEALLGAFVLKLPVYWVVALSTAEELSKFVIGLKRLKSNKWIRNVTV
ncbi:MULTISPECIES: hypothetical protein [Clostridium]|uniref:Uncharacterized protein n=1 Tax=Clostridium sporogenes TaxID=1509 RepID=A0A7U4JQQ9_CLOSG|nr:MULTISPECIES: hypothetical protein [Clostridium]AKC63572.1 hypothetical protein CLSPO_c28520 [Clostridium sporogenes]KCZ67270.1 hypothetical protein CSPO_9c02850 [Clostridium sporogenes]MBA4507741.1 hypothetical protein [Clostridium sporogenes]MBY7015419.1 hypothetical protein [Clostridium sporogenes]MCW6122841.1 hypothetical protein [Clostridium sporogenes]